jgi:hypothetical protein
MGVVSDAAQRAAWSMEWDEDGRLVDDEPDYDY